MNGGATPAQAHGSLTLPADFAAPTERIGISPATTRYKFVTDHIDTELDQLDQRLMRVEATPTVAHERKR
jgi:hypothetical protein